MPEDFNQPTGEFKPNIYPIMYWALAFGVIAGTILFLINLLSQYITFVWVPVFLAGLVWGAYRNYQRQKNAWSNNNGIPLEPKSALNEFKEAAQDILSASREMMAERAAEDAYERQIAEQAAFEESQLEMQEELPEEDDSDYQPQQQQPQAIEPEPQRPPSVPDQQYAPPNTPPQQQNFNQQNNNFPPEQPKV